MRGKDRTVLPAAKFLDATTFSFDNLDFTFLLACHVYLSSHFNREIAKRIQSQKVDESIQSYLRILYLGSTKIFICSKYVLKCLWYNVPSTFLYSPVHEQPVLGTQ
jgi:hypothetical protein